MKLQPVPAAALPEGIDQQALAAELAANPHHDEPWYALALLTLGAWLTALAGIGALLAGLSLIMEISGGGPIFTMGFVLLGFTAAVARKAESLFQQQAATVIALAAQALSVAGLGILTEAIGPAAGLSLVITAGFASFLPLPGLGFLSTGGTLIVLGVALGDLGFRYWADLLLVPATLAGGWLLLQPPAGRRWNGIAYALLLAAPVTGWLLNMGSSHSRELNDLIIAHGDAPPLAGWATKLVWTGLAAFALTRLQPALPQRQQWAALAVLVLLMFAEPLTAAAATAMLVIGYVSAARPLVILGGLALILGLGQFYYQLSLTLLEKSWLLTGIGVIALTGWWSLFWNRADSAAMAEARRPWLPRVAVAGVMGLVIATLAYQAVSSREAIIAEGQIVMLPLAPVDPRALLQGDYMRLRIDPEVLPDPNIQPRIGTVTLDLDKDGIALGVATPPSSEGGISLDRHKGTVAQAKLRYNPQRGGFGRQGVPEYGIDSFFFQEGHGRFYSLARYAVLKVSKNGEAVLTGLADANRHVIDPANDPEPVLPELRFMDRLAPVPESGPEPEPEAEPVPLEPEP
jgi:hypothetical protein